MSTGAAAAQPNVPFLARALRLYLRSELRGGTRLSVALARRVRALHHVPVTIGSGVLYVDLRDGFARLLLQHSPWAVSPLEPDEQAIMSQLVRPGEVVFDIGGHIGLHTSHLAQLVGPTGAVHVFEANPQRHDCLERTAAACRNVTLHRLALSDHNGQLPLFVPMDDHSMASLANWTEGRVGAVGEVMCRVRRLDAIVDEQALEHPAFIKCDVEGAERRVFEGARSILDREDAPCVMYEANARSARAFGESMSAASEWLAALQRPAWRFFHVQPQGRLVPILPTLTEEHDHFNLVAVPAARADRLR